MARERHESEETDRAQEFQHVRSDPEDRVDWEQVVPRLIPPEKWRRMEKNIAEIFEAFGMDMNTPGTTRTPERYLRALFDSTMGYEGDEKLLTAFPTECRGGPDCRISQVIEGPISFFALCEHHSLPFFGLAHGGTWPTSRSSASLS